jgi:SAM-dependent methyltransferase
MVTPVSRQGAVSEICPKMKSTCCWIKGRAVNFAQRLAEDTGFPDGHFDIVASYILHHELPLHVSQQVIKESYRISRPGGVFYPVDSIPGY